MLVVLYNFGKRPNSTKEPNPMDATRKEIPDVQLKENCSYLSPTLIISNDVLGAGFSPVKYNYVSIPYWLHHYFVKDWRWVAPYWEVDLTVDVLASFKYAIGDTDAYILRSSAAFNGSVADAFYPTKTDTIIRRQNIDGEIYHKHLSEGCFVIGCINNQTAYRVGAVSYYALNDTQMGQLMSYLFSDNIYNEDDPGDMTTGMWKSMFNPFQYIVSCMWFPYAASTFGTTTGNIRCGFWSTNVSGVLVNYVISEYGIKTQIPIYRHPQSDRGEYVNHAPYTRVTAYIPPFGEIPVDTNYMQFGDNNYLYGKIYLDAITGKADVQLTITDGYDPDVIDPYKIMVTKSSQIGVPIQIAQIMTDYLQSMQSAGGAIGSALTGNLGGLFSGIINTVNNLTPKMSTSGANGSLLEILEPPLLIVENYMLVEENRAEFGRPLCSTMKIKNIPGYIQCGEADHEFACSDVEREMINNFLKTGFYYE